MNKKNVSLGLVVLVVALVALGLNFYRIGQKNEVANMTGQKQKMYTVIASAHQREADYKKDYASLPQPVKMSEVDRIQNTLISNMKVFGLDIVSITKKTEAAPVSPQPGQPPQAAGSKPPAPTGVIYEAVVQGKWESIMTYLNGLQAGPILCQVKSVKMEASPVSDVVKTSFTYKLYTE